MAEAGPVGLEPSFVRSNFDGVLLRPGLAVASIASIKSPIQKLCSHVAKSLAQFLLHAVQFVRGKRGLKLF